MTWQRWFFLPLLLAPLACEPKKADVLRLQREIAMLEERVRTLQRSFDERSSETSAMVQKTLDRVSEVHTAAVVIDSTLKERTRQQEQTVRRPVASLGSKMDRMTSELLAVRDTMAELNARLKHLEQNLADMDTAVRIIQAPPPPPPPAAEAPGRPRAGATVDRSVPR